MSRKILGDYQSSLEMPLLASIKMFPPRDGQGLVWERWSGAHRGADGALATPAT
jgi:hypothetical protein